MKKEILAEIHIIKGKDKKSQKSLVSTLLELILIKQISMIMEEEVLRLLNKLKYKIKNQLKDELSKILLGLEFKSNNSINSKC